MKRLNTWGRASLAGEAQSSSPPGVKAVGKAGMGQGCEQLKDPEAGEASPAFGGACGSTVPMCLRPSLPKQQATQTSPSQLGEDAPLRGSLVASFLGLFVGKTEVTPHKIHLRYYRVNAEFAQRIWAGQLAEILTLCSSWR